MRNYVEIACQYIDDVLSGEVIACELVKLACERQLRDLKAQNSRKFPYYFDVDTANRVCAFIEKMPHIKGEWAKRGELLVLEPWQCFLVTTLMGWKCARTIVDQDGNEMMRAHTRRFRTSYNEVARKNAKSTLLSAVGNYMAFADGEEGAEVYSAATTHKQAKIVWQDAAKMARKAAGFRDYFGVQVNAKNISCMDTASFFEPLHSQGETLDGLNVHLAIADELHAHKKRDLWDVLETATGSRLQSLMWAITTAGTNRAGICYELRNYAVKVLKRIFDDDQFFALIYTLDKDDNAMDRSVWQKANPNYGVSVYPLDMERLARKASETPAAMNNFKTKRLNIWCNAAAALFNMEHWDACADPKLKEKDFKDDECWIGNDFASKIDLTCSGRLYKREIDGEAHAYWFPDFYLPATTIEEGANSQYEGWRDQKLIIETPGDMIDMDQIESDVIEKADILNLIECCFDPGHNATQWAGHLEDEGIDMVEIRPSTLNFSEPLKWIIAMVKAGRFHHAGHAVMDWNISNTVGHYDNKDNVYPRKELPENKIDGVIALCTAMNRWLADEPESDPTVIAV